MTALRVAVTRDEGPDGDLSRALRAHGLEPVPCASVARRDAPDSERLTAAARSLENYDWLIVASVRGVEALMAARDQRPLPASLRTAAVGERTAERLAACGAASPLTAPAAGAHALIEMLRRQGPWAGRRCLLPRALDGGTALGDTLRALGAEVDEVAAYRTEPRTREEIAAAWRAAAPDAAVIASPSAASALVAAIGVPALTRLRAVVAIGPTTREALSSRGVNAMTPEQANFDSVAQLLSGLTESEESR